MVEREASSSSDIPEAFNFDEQRLQSAETQEKQELYLLQWLAQVEREIKTIPVDTLKRAQPVLEKTLLRFISLSTAKPRRPIRFLIGRCYVLLYTRGDTKQLFDTVTALHSLISASKNIDKETKIAAIATTGVLMEVVGSKILSLYGETANILLKVVKNHNNSLLLRLEAINAFTQLLKGAGKAATEGSLKDWMKHLKQGLVDKTLAVRIATAQCIQASIRHTSQAYTPNDVENLLQIIIKSFENSSFPVRRASSSLCATLLEFTQSPAMTDQNKPNIKYSMTGGDPLATTKKVQGIQSDTTLLTIDEMLQQLSVCYNRPTTTRETKIAIIESYATLFTLLGTDFVETNYATIVKHIFSELLEGGSKPMVVDASSGAFNRAQVLFLLYNTIGKRLLSEQGQAAAIRILVTQWIKSWPSLTPTKPSANKHTLICATNLVSFLVCELEGAAVSVQDVLVDPLFVLLTHPSLSVQTAAIWCIRCVCYSVPANLPYLLPRSLNALEKDLANLSNPSTTIQIHQRTIAYAHASAAIMSVFPARPIYTSFDLSARAMAIATQLLKNINKETRIASIQVQVAWILVGSLMCLGPNLVKLHLPQLLLFWKSALPKPTGKEANAIRNEAEWSYSLHARECAVTSIYSFLLHNNLSLVTLDIAKRVSALLNNVFAFLATAPATFSPSVVSPCLPYETKLTDQYYTLRRRLFQCFVTLRPLLSTYESSLTSLLRNSLAIFTEPERVTPSSGTRSQVTASVPGQFVSLWSATDGHGYGVTSKLKGYHVDVGTVDADQYEDNLRGKEWVTKDRFERIEELLERPIIGSAELDPLYLYTTFDKDARKTAIPQPVAPSTSYVDASIELFATLFPSQPPPVQESTYEQIAKVVKDSRSEKNSPKRAAVLVNVVVALLGALKNMMTASKSHQQQKNTSPGQRKNGNNTDIVVQETIAIGRATQLVQEILMEAVGHPDPYLRNAASETMGRLTAIVGGSFVASQMQQLVDLVVSNRDPDVRAGCALTIGYIYCHVGGMAAAPHLKTIVGILLSLSSDPHPVVHVWALEALAMTVSAAGLMFSGFVNSTLGMVTKLYLSETHEPGSGSVAVSNAGMSVGFTAYQEFGRIIYELIGTLGPELQASSKIRELCLNMVEELKLEPDERVNLEAIRCIQHFLMFAPQYLETHELVPYLQNQLTCLHIPLKKAAVTCLYQLVQRDASLVFKSAQPGLDNELFKMLDTDPGLFDVKNVIKSWLKETCVQEPSVWVNITKRILTRNTPLENASSAGETSEFESPFDNGNRGSKTGDRAFGGDGDDGNDFDDDYGDDDADGFGDDDIIDIPTSVADASGMTSKLSVNVEIPPRWRTQLFALQCLQKTIDLISTYGGPEHFNLVLARKRRQQAGLGDYLVFRVPDLIRLSFTAATAQVNELRLGGIALLKMVIEKFAGTEDADLEEMLLLEQYAAQIGAALTPAFGSDSSSEIVSAAVRVCAIYVGSGIVKDLYQLGRVLKLLTSALDRCKDESKLSGVGEVKDLSPHASVMVKLSVLNAWAELQVASQKQDYLRQILQPNLAALSPLWLRSLQDYARIRLESDITALSSSTEGLHASSSGGMDSMYSAATKEVVLPYYRRSWLKIMEAVATLIETKSPSMMEALSKNSNYTSTTDSEGKKPSDLFYILFGLCVENLSRISSSSSGRSDVSSMMVICLNALKTFVQPSLTGAQFLPKAIFLEFMNVFDRLIQTEGYHVQLIIIETIQRLIAFYGAEFLCDDLENSTESYGDLIAVNDSLDSDVFPTTAKLYYLLRLLVNVFVHHIPSLRNKSLSARPFIDNDKDTVSSLQQRSLDALAQMIKITPPKYRVDLLAISLHICIEILTSRELHATLGPSVLVCMKIMLHQIESDLSSSEIRSLSKVVCNALRILLRSVFVDTSSEENIQLGKNQLLASVLIITGCPQAVAQNPEGLDLLIDVVKNGLAVEDSEIIRVCHQCIRTLLVLPEKATGCDASKLLGRQFTSAIMPLLLNRILSHQSSDSNSQKSTPASMESLSDDIKTLTVLPTSAPEKQSTAKRRKRKKTHVPVLANLFLLFWHQKSNYYKSSYQHWWYCSTILHLMKIYRCFIRL
ncbi:armadillo-type protein [Absidia repens]|uniref:Armadillo-type protein n=1 Tax=Absidia repens TaxID=90262 RepID=A0A1X2IU25_9FUNG|nr:armadillo-type protein [Absidia repens]